MSLFFFSLHIVQRLYKKYSKRFLKCTQVKFSFVKNNCQSRNTIIPPATFGQIFKTDDVTFSLKSKFYWINFFLLNNYNGYCACCFDNMLKRKHVHTIQIIINHNCITNNLKTVSFGHFLCVNVLLQYDPKNVMQNTRVFACLFLCVYVLVSLI